MDKATIKSQPGKILNSIRFLKTMRKNVKNLRFSQGNSTGIKNLTKLIRAKQHERLTTKNLLIPPKLVVSTDKRKGSFKPIKKTPFEKINDVMLKERTPIECYYMYNRKQKRSYKHEVKRLQQIERTKKIHENERRQEEINRKVEEEKIGKIMREPFRCLGNVNVILPKVV